MPPFFKLYIRILLVSSLISGGSYVYKSQFLQNIFSLLFACVFCPVCLMPFVIYRVVHEMSYH